MNPILEKIFRENKISADEAAVSWEDFIGACLFDDESGYYKNPKKSRVGGEGSDFYTSVSLKEKVFSELIFSAARNLIEKRKANFCDFEFVEIGAEPDSQIIENSRVVRLGDEIKIPPRAVVISNELLDSRPFARFKFIDGNWQKGNLSIKKNGNGFSFAEFFGRADSAELTLLERYFPRARVEGFRLDVSFDALKMFADICAKKWTGAFIFADYFRTASELSELPNGTARGYFKHEDFSDITKNAGDADITFSPCSDMLCDIAESFGFSDCAEDSQEKFFVKNAEEKIREMVTEKNPLDFRKRELAQLISPVHMGAAFRVLSGVRMPPFDS